MRKFQLILAIFILFLSTFSCKKDAATTPTPVKENSKLEGTWKIDNIDYNMYVSDNLITSYNEKDKTNTVVTFNTDGTGTFKSDGDENTKFSYALINNTLTFTNVQYSGSGSNYKWRNGVDFTYTEVKLGVNQLTYTKKGSIAQPASYTAYVATVHLTK
ncbi:MULTISPECIES: hypothetical protein [unclassified Mucilaginibacter]|uniref:hypothetical protein n=1 Tax=unclassified Mucilaginibacter TaxID=2617802 RepID=UPI0009685FE4|nr:MULTISPECIES: hypothetical protein [unclassified Mucilaginibacter]OJW14881.1 MAG: hypothetical protein BGO48_11935 [Mucilaginibacter sp. 44-25]PLW91387.1 MAG: hypothetical protein C0154_01465 [Mucilaginibacter sp.]HEK22216.1 hypothetical protein [Bacteroidota bacterium]